MLVQKQAVGNFAKVGEEIKDGDLLTIKDEGREEPNKFNPDKVRYVFTVQLRSGEDKQTNFNQKSINLLIDAGWGQDTTKWIGRSVRAWVFRQLIDKKVCNVLYVTDPQFDVEGKPLQGEIPIVESDFPPPSAYTSSYDK